MTNEQALRRGGVLLLAAAALLGAAGCDRMEERFKPLGVGDPAPAYAARMLDNAGAVPDTVSGAVTPSSEDTLSGDVTLSSDAAKGAANGDSARVGAGAGAQPLTLVNVWATWCIPCQEEFPDLQAIHQEYAGRGLRILAVSIDAGGDDEVRAFVREMKTTFPIARDESGRIRQLYQSVGVPETYLLSADGTVLWRQPGALPKGAGTARAAIDAALRGAGKS